MRWPRLSREDCPHVLSGGPLAALSSLGASGNDGKAQHKFPLAVTLQQVPCSVDSGTVSTNLRQASRIEPEHCGHERDERLTGLRRQQPIELRLGLRREHQYQRRGECQRPTGFACQRHIWFPNRALRVHAYYKLQ